MRIFSVLLLIGLFYGAYAMLARFALAGEANTRSLAVSVGRASGSPGEMLNDRARCKRTSPGVWRCSEVDREGSGVAVHRVRTHGHCWDARLIRGAMMDDRVSGCVHRWQWSLLH
jgi:hypothetical protein